MLDSDRLRLYQIKCHCEDIAGFIERFGGYDQFTADTAYHNAACMSLMQIGELANFVLKHRHRWNGRSFAV